MRARARRMRIGATRPSIGSATPARRASSSRFGSNQRLQAGVQIGRAGDALEHAADRAAAAVLAGRDAPALGRSASGSHSVRRQPNSPDGASRQAPGAAGPAAQAAAALSARGEPLPPTARAYFEARFGRGFGAVRIHRDAAAARGADAIGASAYTVGQDIGFAARAYAPDSGKGLRLLAHELAHVAQQADAETPPVQRQEKSGAEKAGEEEDDAGKIVAEGLKIAAEQAKDNNPAVKEKLIKPIEDRAKSEWGKLSGGEKGVVIGFGAATASLGLGAMLSDPKGREMLSTTLEGVNLAGPLGLIPYMPLTEFKYTLPKTTEEGGAPGAGAGEASDFKFKTAFSGDQWLDLLRSRFPRLPPLSLKVGMDWRYDPDASRLSVTGAQANLTVLKGISLSGGTVSGVPALPERYQTAEGGSVEVKKRLPEAPPAATGAAAPAPGVQVMLTVDLLKLDRSFLPRSVRQVIQAF